METITGYVEHIVFRNEENGYTVMEFVTEGKRVTCVGTFLTITEGLDMELTGEKTEHSAYGKQFRVTEYWEKEPEDMEAIERYLGSGAIKGIGKAMADRIVRRFKEDTFRIIEEEPERLAEIKGISARGAQKIAQQVEEKKDLRQAMIFLQQYGLSLSLEVKIYEKYKKRIYTIIKENPYQLAEDIDGIGFKMADEIAEKVGIRKNSDYRIRSGILYALTQAGREGHTYLPEEELIRECRNLLGVNLQQMEKYYMDLVMEKKLVVKEPADKQKQVFASAVYYMEMNTAAMLKKLDMEYDVPDIEIETRMRQIEKKEKIQLGEQQVLAVKEAVKHGLFIVTGGPGTGKTTTINTIIQYFEADDVEIALAAPTGRAAKRMSEATGYEARTIHRLLEMKGGVEGFERDDTNPLEADVIIIDEMSMVDIYLMHALLKAIVPGTRLILVGDVDQLPSVGPGSVLKDIIDSNQFQVVCLNTIFRQAEESDIVVNAHKINRGEVVNLGKKSRDFSFLRRYDADTIINTILYLFRPGLAEYVQADLFDIQVLTPMRKGLIGVERLNRILQQHLNPPSSEKKEHEVGERLFREGDKVMQTRNNYQIKWEIKGRYGLTVENGEGIFNGDMGRIRKIETFASYMEIEFDGNHIVEYPFEQLEDLELAYAITIHKSQGSEYPAVVIPILDGPRMLMNRNLLYTAVTRARKYVALVGDERTFQKMEENANQQKRYSGLCDRLREV